MFSYILAIHKTCFKVSVYRSLLPLPEEGWKQAYSSNEFN